LEDKRHGQGTLYYANGDVFNGRWENDMKNGPGVYYSLFNNFK
jgi:hypothetical protein